MNQMPSSSAGIVECGNSNLSHRFDSLRMRGHRKLLLRALTGTLLIFIAVLMAGEVVWSAPPQLTRCIPNAVTPGESADVVIWGEHLGSLSSVWTSFPARCEILPPAEGTDANKQRTIRMTVPRELQLGVGALRTVSSDGVSNAQLLMVDDLPSVDAVDSHHELQTAQAVAAAVAVVGKTTPLLSDYYKFPAEAGQKISVEVLAQRIGSKLDSTIRLLDANGLEVAINDDESGMGADSRLRYCVAEAGNYYIEIRDMRYQGSDLHYYRLRVGDFPLVTTTFPLAGKSGEVTTLQVAGRAVEGIGPINTQFSKASPEISTLSVRFPQGQAGGFVTVLSDHRDEKMESEPNNDPKQATKVTLPCAINGRFMEAGDRDYYEFEVKKGQRWSFRGQTQRYGSPADLYLELLNADGDLLKEIDDVGNREGLLDYEFPADGTYRLLAENLVEDGSPAHVYRIEVDLFNDWFTLTLDKETHNVPQGGTFATTVTATRQGYQGAIELGIDGIEVDVRVENNVIAEDKNDTQMTVTFPEEIEPGRLEFVRIWGKAEVDGQPVKVLVSGLDAWRTVAPQTPNRPASLDDRIALGFGPVFPEFFNVKLAYGVAYFPQRIGAASVPIDVTRINSNFKEAVSFAVENLPEGFTAEVKPVGDGQKQYLLNLKGSKDLEGGDYNFRLVSTGTFEHQTKKVVLDTVPLQVVQPLVVLLEPQGPIAPDGKQTLKIRVVRFGEEKHAVAFRWKQGPAVISAPIEIAIPADKDELDIQLVAAPELTDETNNELVAVVTTQVDGEEVSVESKPVLLEISKP